RSSPASSRIVSVRTRPFAVPTPPESFLQVAQWQNTTAWNSSGSSNRTPPHWQLPCSVATTRAYRVGRRRSARVDIRVLRWRNRQMGRPWQAVSVLAALARNGNLRRVELAWGASIAAEWTHFVALGVFAYNVGGASAVGIAGLVRMLPAALVAPFAATLGDRFRRERFLVVVSLGGSAAAYFVSRSELIVFALAGVVGVTSTIFRPALQATLPSLARTPQELIAANGATSTLESLGTLLGPLVAGVLVSVANAGVVFLVASGALLVAAGLVQRVVVEGRIQATAPA